MEKRTNINIRISPHDKNIIKAKARELEISVSEYLTRAGLQRKLPRAMEKTELEVWLMLKQYQSNFRRISNLIKKRNPSLDVEIKKMIQELENDLNYVRNGKPS